MYVVFILFLFIAILFKFQKEEMYLISNKQIDDKTSEILENPTIQESKTILSKTLNYLNRNTIERKISKIYYIEKVKRENTILWKFIVSFYEIEHKYEIIIKETSNDIELIKFNIDNTNTYKKVENYEAVNSFEYAYDLNVANYSKHSLCDYTFPELPKPLSDRSVRERESTCSN